MRDKDGWDLTKKQREKYLESIKMLYGGESKGQVGIVPPRLNLEDLGVQHYVSPNAARLVFGSCPEIPGNSKVHTVPKVPRGTTKTKTRKEWREQEDIYRWSQMIQTLRGHVMMIGNEGRRTVVQAAVAKRMGLLAGSSDLFVALPVTPYAGLWLEVKQNRSYSMSERKKDSWQRQEAFQARMRSVGYAATFAFGAEHGIKIIKRYMEPNQTDYAIPPDRVDP
jgi:hypothetical protein